MAGLKIKQVPVWAVVLSIVLVLLIVNTAIYGSKAFKIEGPIQTLLTLDVTGRGAVNPGTGTHAYNEGAMVILEAQPEAGWTFSHWEGAVSDTLSPRTMLSLESDEAVKAIFVEDRPDYYNLTLKVAGRGSVFPYEGKQQIDAVAEGMLVTVSAYPASGYIFESWTEDGSVVSNDPNYDLLVDRDVTLTANFVSLYSVTVSATEGGTAAGAVQGLMKGARVTVTARANQGYGFEKWTESGKTVSTIPDFSFNVEGNRNLKAHFLRVYSVNVSSNAGGTVTSSVSHALQGTQVRVTAQPHPGYAFLKWEEENVSLDLSGIDLELQHYSSPVYDFKLDRNRNLVATFVPVYNIDVDSTAGGSVTVPATTVAETTKGVVIAVPDPGFGFEKWTEDGVLVGTNPIYQFTGERNRSLKAHFLRVHQITLLPYPAAGGLVWGDGVYNEGTDVTLRAYPNYLTKFVGWEKDGVLVSTEQKFIIENVNEAQTLTARFELPVHVDVHVDQASGGLARALLHDDHDRLSPGNGLYEHGSRITVEARPKLGYAVDHWLKDGVPVSDATRYTFDARQDTVLTVKFSAVGTYQVDVSSSLEEGGIVYGSGSHNVGSAVTVYALPRTGYRFVDWTENGVSVSSDRNFTFSLTDNRALVANFARAYPVQLSADPDIGGRVSGVGFFRVGETVTVEAKPSFGYRFDGWTENGAAVSSDPVYTFEMAAPRDLVANFVEAHWVLVNIVTGLDDPGIAGSISGEGFTDLYNTVEGMEVVVGAQGFFDMGDTVTLTANPNENYMLQKWTDTTTRVLSTENTYQFVVDGPAVINVYFMPTRFVDLDVDPPAAGYAYGEGHFILRNMVTVEAEAAPGYRWDRWTEEDGTFLSGAFRYTFRLLDHRSLVANFIRQYNITVDIHPEGSGTVSGARIYDIGDIVSLIATHNFGYRFAAWVESPGIIVGLERVLPPFTATSDRHFVANFVEWPTHNIELSVNETEWGYVTGAGLYEQDEPATARAYANYGYRFVNWTENGAVVYDGDDPAGETYTFTVLEERSLVANFEVIPAYTIAASVEPPDGGSVTGTGVYLEGETANLTASPNQYFAFVNWTEDGVEIETSRNISFTVTEERHLVANFVEVAELMIYDHGDELVDIARGIFWHNAERQDAKELIKNPDHLLLRAQGTRTAKSGSNGIVEVAFVTDEPVDLTGYLTVYVQWYNDGASSNNNESYLIASTVRGIDNGTNTGGYNVYNARVQERNRFGSAEALVTSSIDVSGLDGLYYIRVHARDSITSRNNSALSQLRVYKIWAE